jgi:hypothetical protein
MNLTKLIALRQRVIHRSKPIPGFDKISAQMHELRRTVEGVL